MKTDLDAAGHGGIRGAGALLVFSRHTDGGSELWRIVGRRARRIAASLPALSGPVDAQLTSAGLFYSSAAGGHGRVAFESLAAVLRRLR